MTQILLAEDHAGDTELILESFARELFADRVEVVDNGEDALDYVFCRGRFGARRFETPPRLILLDVKLPKVTGLEVLRAIKADPRTQPIPVVMLTSSKIERDVALAYRLGANSYIHKPMDFPKFREALAQVARYWLGSNEGPPRSAFAPDGG